MDEEILHIIEEDIDNISILNQLLTLPPRVSKRGHPKG